MKGALAPSVRTEISVCKSSLRSIYTEIIVPTAFAESHYITKTADHEVIAERNDKIKDVAKRKLYFFGPTA